MVLFLFYSNTAFAADTSSGSSILNLALWTTAILIIFFIIIQVADNLIKIEAKDAGVTNENGKFSLFPSFSAIFSPKTPDYVGNDGIHVLKAGHDIILEGEAEKTINKSIRATTFAIQPQNFIGISPIPKVTVEIGDEIKAGEVVCFDKKRPTIKYVAPVSGEVIAVNRGEKRSIKEIVILADKEISYKSLPAINLDKSSREELVNYLLESGVWPMICQRPFGIVPDPADIPKGIFISTFDSAPLSPDLEFCCNRKRKIFSKRLRCFRKINNG